MNSDETKTAIIVDDIALMRAILKDFLRKIDFSIVAEASSGREAVEQCMIHSPDLMTMDLSMPGVKGIDAIRAIRAFNSSTKIIVVSAGGSEKSVVDAISAGANNFIVKPFKERKIVEVIKSLFEI